MKPPSRIFAFLALFLLSPVLLRAQFTLWTNGSGAIVIAGYSGAGGDVVIPSTINGRTVVGIGMWAFQELQSITTVSIPSGVTFIGDFAFRGCRSLTGVTLPDTLTNIGAVAFAGCVNMDTQLPNSLTTVGFEAFFGCGLKAVTIPATLTNIDIYPPFSSCSNLVSIEVDTSNPVFSSRNGAWYDKTGTRLIQYPAGRAGNGSIPFEVTTVGRKAFAGSLISSITIPASVTNVGWYAFRACRQLKQAILSTNLDTLSIGMFSLCSDLTNMFIPDTVLSIQDDTFAECTNLQQIGLSHSLRQIGNQAFYSCRALAKLDLPSSLDYIDSEAFRSCNGLTTLVLPEGVTNIRAYAFETCSNLVGLFFKGNAPTFGASVFNGTTNVVLYYLPGKVGWPSVVQGRPVKLWNPTVTSDSSGVHGGRFILKLAGTPEIPVTIERSSDLSTADWTFLQTVAITNGSIQFTDDQVLNSPARFYRLRSP